MLWFLWRNPDVDLGTTFIYGFDFVEFFLASSPDRISLLWPALAARVLSTLEDWIMDVCTLESQLKDSNRIGVMFKYMQLIAFLEGNEADYVMLNSCCGNVTCWLS